MNSTRALGLAVALVSILGIVPGANALRGEEPKPARAPEAAASKDAPAPPEPDPEAELRAREKRSIEAFRTRCEALINDKDYDVKETPHYVVETDDPRLEVKEPSALLESFRTWFDLFWSGRTDLRPHEDKSFVFLFYSYYKYKQLLDGAETAGEIRPIGHYMGQYDVVALHTDSVGAGDLPDILVHEAAHQLIQTRIFGPDAAPSPWVSEGLASYFGFTFRDRSGKFVAGEIGGKEGVVFFPHASRSSARDGSEILAAYRAKIKKGELGALDKVISIGDPSEFHAGDPRETYAASWLLVHFLLHADGGAHAAAFVTYLHHEIEGKRGPSVFFKDIGLMPEVLDAAYREYVRNLKGH